MQYFCIARLQWKFGIDVTQLGWYIWVAHFSALLLYRLFLAKIVLGYVSLFSSRLFSANSRTLAVQSRLGAHYRYAGTGNEQDFDVAKIISHPSYHSPKRYSHDIALVKLAQPALISNAVSTVCLPDENTDPMPFSSGKHCWISGWGRLAAGGASPNVLMQASVPLVSRFVIKRFWGFMYVNCVPLGETGIA